MTGTRIADDVKNKAASTVENIADMASRATGEAARVATQTTERAAALGQSAADRLSATSDYVRKADVTTMVSDLKSYARSHPTHALLGAAAAGFLAAVLLRRR
jgi:ElaB/YqjD/DUF883 family membrane-anchored ribosome-binding protein